MKREDVIQVDQLKDALSGAFRTFEQSMRGVFGELVYGIDTVIEHHNALEARLDATEAQLATVAKRLLALEELNNDKH